MTGDCSAIGWVTNSASDSGFGLLGCDCHGIDVLLPAICEVDRKLDFIIPARAQFVVYFDQRLGVHKTG